MNYQKAIEILGLKPNFLDEELKKVYRKLAREYHPDNFVNNSVRQRLAEEKMKDINKAYEYLEKVKSETGSYHTEYNAEFIKKYRQEVIDKLKEFVKDSKPNEDYPSYYKAYYDRIAYFVNIHVEKIKETDTVVLIDSAYNYAFAQIKNELNMLQNEFLLNEGLSVKDALSNPNYNCSIREFYEELLNIKKEKKKNIEDSIKHEVLEYELWAQYSFVSDGIDKIVHETIKKAREKEYKNVNELLVLMHKQIRELFDKHTSLLKRIESIFQFFINKYGVEAINRVTNDKRRIPLLELAVKTSVEEEGIKIIKALEECRAGYTDITKYDETLKALDRVASDFENFKLHREISNQEEDIKTIFYIVNAKLADTLKKYSAYESIETPYKAIEVMACFLELYELMRRNELDTEDGNLLRELTFEDWEHDSKLLDGLITKINKRKSLEVFIILSKTMNLGSKVFTKKDEDEEVVNLLYFVGYAKRKMTIPKELLQNEYIPLETMLLNATFIGKREIETGALVLYTWSDFVIRLINGRFIIDNEPLGTLEYDFRTVPYKNKEFTKQMILKEIYSKFIHYNEDIKDPREQGKSRTRSYLNKFSWLKNLIK